VKKVKMNVLDLLPTLGRHLVCTARLSGYGHRAIVHPQGAVQRAIVAIEALANFHYGIRPDYACGLRLFVRGVELPSTLLQSERRGYMHSSCSTCKSAQIPSN
jgi:hypothetical protein